MEVEAAVLRAYHGQIKRSKKKVIRQSCAFSEVLIVTRQIRFKSGIELQYNTLKQMKILQSILPG